MAGLGNKVFFGEGLRLQPTSADSLLGMQQLSTDVGSINHTGNPEGVVSANPSSICHDPVSGNIYVKQSGSGNTGWTLISTAIDLPIGSLQYFSQGGTDTTYPSADWLPCDGSVISQATYSVLFSRIGLLNYGGTVWTRQNPLTSANISAISYGNSAYVYGTSSGQIFSSTDGITWTLQVSGTSSAINALIYGTVFVYAGNGGGLSTSTDGITWTSRTSGTATAIQALTYNSGTFVYCGAGVIASSTDAITWTARKLPSNPTAINALAYGNGVFVAIGAAGQAWTSTDGTTWDTKLPLVGPNLSTHGSSDLIYAGGQFVSGGPNGTLCTSTDGVRWVGRVTGSTSTFNSLVFGTVYVAGGAGGLIESSTDGITWTSRTSQTSSSIYAVGYGNSTYVYGAVGGGGGTSTDGTTWVAHNSGSASQINSITYGSVFVYGLNGGAIFTSTDGVTFTSRTSGTSSNIYSVINANSIYLYGGAGGTMATSTDGITWTSRTSGTTSSILSLTYGTVFVLGTNLGGISTSTDGITWTARSSNTGSNIFALAYQGGLYYAAGGSANDGYMLTSTDAITWNPVVQLGSANAGASLTYGTQFVAGGQGGLLATSTNGMSWTLRTGVNLVGVNATFTFSVTGLTYANSRYLGVGGATSGGDPFANMITSTDGISWYSIKNASLTTLNAVVFGTVYVAVGNSGETETSSGTYSYNSATSFQLPTDNDAQLTIEAGNNFIKKLYVKAL